MTDSSPLRGSRRPSPPAVAALFALAGIVLLLGPQLLAKYASGGAPDATVVAGDVIFLAIGAAAAGYLASRIGSAFRREAAARATVEDRERVLADVIDVVPAAVLLLADANDLVVAHANPAAVRLLGLGPLGEPPPRLQAVLSIDLATVDALTGALAAGSRWTGERVVTTAAGRRLPLAIGVTPISPAGGVRAVLVATDRSELRYAERESERLSVELEGFVETAPIGFVTVGADGLVAAWNAAAERILGWTAAEMVGSRLPAELGAVIEARLASGAGVPGGQRAVVAVPVDSPEVRVPGARGQAVVVRLTAVTFYGRDNDFFGFTAMFEDVTEARRITLERDEAESRFRAAFDASPVALVLLDAEGKVRLWSAAAEQLFGWPADEAMGRLFPPVPDEGLPRFFERLRRVVDGEPTGGELSRYVARDGGALPVRVWSRPVHAADGSLVGVMGAFEEEAETTRA